MQNPAKMKAQKFSANRIANIIKGIINRSQLKYYLVILFSIMMFNGTSQKILSEYDSIAVSKPKMTIKTYQFNNPFLNEIAIVNSKPKAISDNPNKFWKNLTGGAITLFTGISTGSSDVSLWVTENKLKTNNSEYDWEIHFFFEGEYSKTRERIKNDDGSTSVSTEKGIYINWSKQTYGLIIEKNDTVGDFDLLTNLQTDIESNNWLTKMENESAIVRSKTSKFLPSQMFYDFKVTGVYKERYFKIITSGSNFKSLILFDSKPVAMFQGEPNYVLLGKKNRIEKYLLYEKMMSDSEIVDLLRLSMLSRLLANSVSVNFYEL